MTNPEFSNEFDILYNNIASNQAPGLDEYEKSVFLTNAQDAIALELYSGKNVLGDSFEKTEEVRQYLSNIVTTATLEEVEDDTIKKVSTNSTLFNLPEDVWFITHESVEFEDNTCSALVEVVPVTQDEFSRINKNPFKRASNNRVLRLNIAGMIELVSNKKIKSYTIRYMSRLNPIVLNNICPLTIRGINTTTECELHPALHEAILGRAVQLAKASMGLLETGQTN